LSGVGALWDCVPRVCGGGGGCAGGGVPLGVVPALSWCGEVSLEGILIINHTDRNSVHTRSTRSDGCEWGGVRGRSKGALCA